MKIILIFLISLLLVISCTEEESIPVFSQETVDNFLKECDTYIKVTFIPNQPLTNVTSYNVAITTNKGRRYILGSAYDKLYIEETKKLYKFKPENDIFILEYLYKLGFKIIKTNSDLTIFILERWKAKDDDKDIDKIKNK